MAITQNTFTGDGSTTNFSFTFEYIKQADVKASLDGTATTAFTLANATTLSFNTAPANGVAIRIFRDTDIDSLKATFFPGSAIKAEDLNDNFTQTNFAVQEADFDVATSNATANTAKTTADTAIATANTASTNATAAVSTANTASTNASAAVTTANTASTNASNAVTTANSAATDAATAVSTANTATTTANGAVTTANAATATANSAASDASSAVSTANTASTNASNAVSTANSANTAAASAVTTANAATATANSAASDATSAISTANTASTNASNAVSTANTASTNASNAVSTANTASTNASNAVSTANTASTNATTALNNSRESDGSGGFTSAISKANTAISTANAASAAVSNAVLFDLIANVSSIPGSPSNNDYIEIGNSTGIESFTPLSGLPSGFTGAAGLTVRLRYDSSATSWVFMNYFANDSETRYVAIGNPNPVYYANQAAFPSATTYHGGIAHSHADGAMYYAHGGNWIKMAKADNPTFTGNMGVGTTSPQRALVVSDAGAEGFEFYPGSSDTANTLNHYDRASSSFIDIISQADKHIFGRADGEKMRLDSSGRLLIGTTSAPAGTDAQYSKLAVRGNTLNSNACYLSLGNNKSTTNTTSNDNLGIITFNDNDSDAGEYARITGASDGANGTNDYPGKLIFATTSDGASSPSERMRITSAGHVDIGANNGSSSGEGFYLQRDGGGYIFTQSALDAVNIYQSGTKNVEINSSGSAYFASNFGIGTSSPATRLHVNGTTPTMRVSLTARLKL